MAQTETVKRIKEKLSEIVRFGDELVEVLPDKYEEYAEDFKARSASERIFEKIVMAIVDVSFLLVKERNLSAPEEEGEVFSILSEAKILGFELASRLKDAKGMRNILAHEYGEINNELVYNSLSEEIVRDTDEFCECVNRALSFLV